MNTITIKSLNFAGQMILMNSLMEVKFTLMNLFLVKKAEGVNPSLFISISHPNDTPAVSNTYYMELNDHCF